MVQEKHKQSVVVVNDSVTVLNALVGLLRKEGLDVHSFESAESALSALDAGAPPDLIVTDLYMPGIDGWRFCRLLRSPKYAAFNGVPILVASATFAGDNPQRIAADIGANAFLPMQTDGKCFVDQVRALLKGEVVHTPFRVLVVDDSKTLAGLLQKVFISHGYLADTAFTAREAAEIFAKGSYDFAVLDYHLPDGKGDALLHIFQAQRPECVCLMMTSDPTPELALDWMTSGASAYLRKPFAPEYLIELCTHTRRERTLLRVESLLEERTRELRESEERNRLILDHSSDLIWSLSSEGVFTYASAAWKIVTGYTPEEIVGAQFQPLVHEDDVSACVAYLAGIYTTGQPGPLIEYRVRHADGTWHWHKAAVNPLLGPDREVVSVIGVSRDITNLKLAEVALRESEERYRNFFASVEAVKLIIDPANGAIVDANAAALEFYGYDLERLKSMFIYDVNMLPKENVLSELDKASKLEKGYFYFKHHVANGEVRDVEIHTSAIQHQGKHLLMSSIHDITEIRRLEQVKEDVEHILRHDLRAPLTGLISLPLLLMEDENLSPDQRKILHLVAISGRKMLNQIDGSLELHKVENGTYSFNARDCYLTQLLQDNIDILAASKGTNPRSFVVREHTAVGDRFALQTDELLLDVILMNLLRNALEASDPEARVFVDLAEEGDDFVIAIANGRPVPLEIRERFFDKYATAGKVGGTGLGTYSAFIMTRAIGGTITMETSEESGTKVTVRIPIRAREIQ